MYAERTKDVLEGFHEYQFGETYCSQIREVYFRGKLGELKPTPLHDRTRVIKPVPRVGGDFISFFPFRSDRGGQFHEWSQIHVQTDPAE